VIKLKANTNQVTAVFSNMLGESKVNRWIYTALYRYI